ncbi:MAG TPA: multicopper oxidase domain-containing protein [Chryseosolibacter sp.]|nr:multicopper oxidase domain-containing protein [Chryseosolibacter sp.]
MRRREFLKRSSLSALYAWAGSSSIMTACHTEEDMIGKPGWIDNGAFDRPLHMLPVSAGNAALNASLTTTEILKGASSDSFSYAGQILGPTIVANTGEIRDVSLLNNLAEDTNIHWHGLILPENMDGHPRNVAAPGESLYYSLPVSQRAGTYWYHPHAHGRTARQVFMGLAGMFIVRDREEAALNLPSGAYEIPLIIQDKHFSGGNLDYSPTGEEIMTGYLGETVLVNGIHAPYLDVKSGWYRFRILNGSTARVYNIGFSGGVQFHLIGADGGLLRVAETLSSLLLGPGERMDIVVNFSGLQAGKEIYLISNAFLDYGPQGRQSFRIMKIVVNGQAGSDFVLPGTLSAIPSPDPASAVNVRVFDIAEMQSGGHRGMARHTINGKVFDIDRVDETVGAGTTEIWEFDNLEGDEIHPMHIHGVQFQVLERIGGRKKLIASEKGWKDTVLVMPGEKVRVIMTFPSYTGVFVLHCHNLEHEDDGMMLNYQIA